MAKLAGAAEIAPGVRLSDRASPSHRRTSRVFLGEQLAALGLEPHEHAYGTGANVYAELPSTTGGEEWLVVGAHFDTVARSPGANDNATGVALVHGVAQYLARLPCRSRNVAFVFFDQEEIGLVGSKAYANKLAADGVVVRSVHTIDQMGWDSNGDRLIELERPDAGLADLYRAAATELGVATRIVVTSTSSSDHSSFRPRFPAVGVTEGYRSGNTSPDYHRPTDTFDKVDFAYLDATTALVARVIANQLR
ncbi:MAG: M20/M25/M40 family metallo-hydrolase [Labilithrix sp.]|nr:M20/M25/M40 family metallo-hydrolase [Labilithrix sp.]MCW5811644.1 M20/M25/M40 family metallo-hydrolase [Labilithrix sp.]